MEGSWNNCKSRIIASIVRHKGADKCVFVVGGVYTIEENINLGMIQLIQLKLPQ